MISGQNNQFYFSIAYVVFEDNTTLDYLRLLKKGFRHCYLLIKISDHCLLELNPMSNKIYVSLHDLPSVELYLGALSQKKDISLCQVVLEEPACEPAPLGFFTCVEFVKRSIGIHDFLIITPHQLYKRLVKSRAKVIHNHT